MVRSPCRSFSPLGTTSSNRRVYRCRRHGAKIRNSWSKVSLWYYSGYSSYLSQRQLSSSPTQPPNKKTLQVGRIVGAAAGVASLVGVVLVTFCFCRRIRKQKQHHTTSDGEAIAQSTTSGIDPFILPNKIQMRPLAIEKEAGEDITQEDSSELDGHSRNNDPSKNNRNSIRAAVDHSELGSGGSVATTSLETGVGSTETTVGPAMIPMLIERLNQAVAMLPRGGISAAEDAEEPPAYVDP